MSGKGLKTTERVRLNEYLKLLDSVCEQLKEDSASAREAYRQMREFAPALAPEAEAFALAAERRFKASVVSRAALIEMLNQFPDQEAFTRARVIQAARPER